MSQYQLPRRTFLKGVGTAMALPMLDAMCSSAVLAGESAAQTTPTRMAFVFFPNGAIMDSWTPEQEGADYELQPTLKPLEKFKADMNLITGLAQDNGRAKGDGPGDHARSAASYLTGAHPVKTSGANISVGISVDQAAAQEVGHLTKLPSLELGIERGRNAGSCDSGYSCAYSSNISWKTASTPMAKEIHPRLVFERMFGVGLEADKARRQRDHYRKSILDFVAEDAQRLDRQLGVVDRRKMEEYFTSVREIEQRIVRAEDVALQERPDMDLPEGVPSDLTEHIRLMYDLMVLAFRTDTTRIATFMVANEGSNRTYPMVKVTDGHHYLSHHQKDKEKIEKIQRIDEYLVEQFAYFLDQLKATPDGEGNLLDNSMICYGSGLSDGNRHRHDDLPIILAGRAGGTIQTGRHIRYKHETPMNNLFLSMLDRMNAEVAEIGDSTARLKEIDA
jgi:hypothetical protein